MMPSSSPKLRLEALDLGYTYSGETPTQALEGLNLNVGDNEFLAVLGPVGCGKTTLLRIFAGFLQPTKGLVRCDGASVDGPTRGARGAGQAGALPGEPAEIDRPPDTARGAGARLRLVRLSQVAEGLRNVSRQNAVPLFVQRRPHHGVLFCQPREVAKAVLEDLA